MGRWVLAIRDESFGQSFFVSPSSAGCWERGFCARKLRQGFEAVMGWG